MMKRQAKPSSLLQKKVGRTPPEERLTSDLSTLTDAMKKAVALTTMGYPHLHVDSVLGSTVPRKLLPFLRRIVFTQRRVTETAVAKALDEYRVRAAEQRRVSRRRHRELHGAECSSEEA